MGEQLGEIGDQSRRAVVVIARRQRADEGPPVARRSGSDEVRRDAAFKMKMDLGFWQPHDPRPFDLSRHPSEGSSAEKAERKVNSR